MGDALGWAGTRLVLEMGRITRDNLSRDEAMEKIASLLLDSFPVEAAAILIYDPSFKSVYVSSSVAKSDDVTMISEDITLRLQEGSCLTEALKNPHEPTYVPGGTVDPVLGKLTGDSVAIVPMTTGEEVSGFMVLAGKDPSGASGLIPELLMAVGSQTAIVAAKANLIESLRQSEERYQSLMENANDFVFVLDRGGRFLYANSRWADIVELPPEEIVGRYFGEFVTAESWANTVAEVKKAALSHKKHIEYSWVIEERQGSKVTLDVRASLIYQGPDIVLHQGIARDESAEKKLQAELVKRDRELGQSKSREVRMREYLSVANAAQEEERARIARELHDGALQYLVALGRRLDLLRKTVSDDGPLSVGDVSEFRRRTVRELNDMDVLVDTAIDDLRKFARNLRPPVLDDFGLVSACEWLGQQAEKEGLDVTFVSSGEARRLPQDVEISVFRIAQEALSNSIKHSGASWIDFSLEFLEDSLTLTLKDNGQGFDPPSSPGSLVRAGQMGLVGMFERAEILGASIDLKSNKGQGTVLTVTIPLDVKPA
ncbi:MAG: PAS domain S-box protein [Bacillota bacterium]